MQARVQSLGGEIMYWNGDRVMGVLAVSRAIGDHNLRPFVIAQPEVQLDDYVCCFIIPNSSPKQDNCLDVPSASIRSITTDVSTEIVLVMVISAESGADNDLLLRLSHH